MVIESSCKILITSTKASSFLPSYPSLSNAIATYASASLPNSSVRLRVRVGGRTKRIYAISYTMLSFPFLFSLISSLPIQSNPIQSQSQSNLESNQVNHPHPYNQHPTSQAVTPRLSTHAPSKLAHCIAECSERFLLLLSTFMLMLVTSHVTNSKSIRYRGRSNQQADER